MATEPSVLLADRRRGAPAPRWAVDPALLASVGIAARDRSARAMAEMPLARAAAANGALAPDAMRGLVDLATRHLLHTPLVGTGIELGAGLGVLAATVAASDSVDGVLAVEVCPEFVDVVIPRVAALVLGARASKVVPIHGSFDHLELPDACLDFAVEIDSFHHADDLDAVLAETARVLRPGGRLLAFDRVQPDDMPDWLRERMLDHRYSPEFVAESGYPPGIELTRRENGEHEIRRREWFAALARAGFTVERTVELVPAITPRLAAKAALSWLPRPLRRRLVALPVPPAFAPAWVVRTLAPHREAVGSVVFAPKRATGILARRGADGDPPRPRPPGRGDPP